jgi:uroporphyrinogen decarboxylase
MVEDIKKSIIEPLKPAMTYRERFRRVMHFQSVDKITHWEFGYLDETIERWHQEGLPQWLVRGEGEFSVEKYFGVEPVFYIPVEGGIYPHFEGEVKILETKENIRIEQLPDGTIQEVQIKGVKTIPHYIKMPISNKEDWKRFKERLNPDTPGRNVYDYKALNEKLRHLDIPVGVYFGSFYGIPRNWIGFEHISVMLYDQPDLVEDIIETLTQLYEAQLEKALSEIEVDFAAGWEDIAFRNGPMISPSMFKSLVAPRIKRVCDLCRRHGIDVIWTDCDGNINDLVPVWLESGLNCMFPIEVHSGSDPVKLREKYGKQILLRGGLAKHQFSYGKKEIMEELKRVEKIVEEGGYIPHMDHRVPEDIPYENYKYYIKEKLTMLGWKHDEIKQIEPLSQISDTQDYIHMMESLHNQ